MSELQDYYNTGDDGDSTLGLATWRAQTFTASSTYSITSVKLLLHKFAAVVGTITVSIRAVDGANKPTGADLVSGTTDGDTLTADAAGEWREITFDTPYVLVNGVTYAIVIRALTSFANNSLAWRFDSSSPSYIDGTYVGSINSGSTWTINTGIDFMFETYGYECYEYYIGNKEDYIAIYGVDYKDAQIFTPQEYHKITDVSLLLQRSGFFDYPGTITVEIRTTLDSKPTDTVLCSGTTDGDTLNYLSAGEWRNIIFNSSVNLTKNVEYAIVVRAPEGGPGDYINWIGDNSGPGYEKGLSLRTTGGDWIATGKDFNFIEFGMPTVSPVITDQPDDTTVNVGQKAILSIIATGDPIPDYQWYKDDILLSGEVSDTIEFYTEISDAGSYTCKAINVGGSVISDPAIVTVNLNPYMWNLFGLNMDNDRS